MKLNKVIIFSRHGLRYPLLNYADKQGIITPEEVNWEFSDGVLTPRGEILEYRFGQYIREYLKNLDFEIKTKKIRSNSLKRTVLTAKILSLALFPFENIKVEHRYDDFNIIETDFNINIFDEDINRDKLRKVDEDLRPLYNRLEEILNIEKDTIYNKGSDILVNDQGFIYSHGAFKIATDIVDLYILKYYENFKEEDILRNLDLRKEIKKLSEIKDRLLDVIFADMEYILKSEKNAYNLVQEELKNDKDFTLLVGHDSNIATILSALNVDTTNLGNEFEKYPIDSKLVFKVYEDDSFDLDIMYYEIDDIRNMSGVPTCKNLLKNHKFIKLSN